MTLLEAIEIYVERKRSEGFSYGQSEKHLLSMSRHVGKYSLERVTARHIASFLDGPKTSPFTWEKKYGLLRSFFDFWLARGEIEVLPLPAKRRTSHRAFIPYIYTHTEIRAFLKATRTSQRNVSCRIDARTVRTLIIFLYGTGTLLGEAMRLQVDDVDLKKGLLTIRAHRNNRPRTIPIGPDLATILREYMESKLLQGRSAGHFFTNKDGEELNVHTLSATFLRLRRQSGVERRDGARYQPRMHDLRHTFAVHRITGWIRHRADLNRMLPALAAYMGQTGIGSTERYLSLTPERFRTQLDKLSPMRRKKRWRDDQALMKFLAEL
jgi:integrase/recombinase XerD